MTTGETIAATVTTPTVMQTITNKMVEYTDAMVKAMPVVVEKAGEAALKAWEIALSVKQLQGIGELLMTMPYLIGTVAGVFATRWVYSKLKTFDVVAVTIATLSLSSLTVLLASHFLFRIFDVWMWAAIFVPEAAIAYEIWQKFMGN